MEVIKGSTMFGPTLENVLNVYVLEPYSIFNINDNIVSLKETVHLYIPLKLCLLQLNICWGRFMIQVITCDFSLICIAGL